MDCRETVLLEKAQRYGNSFKCGECHSAYRFCRDNVQGWGKLSKEEKRTYICKNKTQTGRGKKRTLIAVTAVGSFVGFEFGFVMICRFDFDLSNFS